MIDRKILHHFFSGTATIDEEKDVCDWVDISDKNKEELIKERKYFDLLLLHKSKDSGITKSIRKFNLFPYVKEVLKIAVMISILIVSALYTYNSIKPIPEAGENKIVVPPGQRVNITLSDGTNVWLNACSEMVYPTFFSQKERIVSLKGEAYFDVAQDAKHPFIVETNSHDIKVVGTKFNVQAGDINCEFATALLEGSVELTNKTNSGPKLLLSPMLKAEWKNGEFVVDSIRDFDSFRWREGLICFENIQFTDLMKRFESVYDIRIIVQNKNLMDYRCSGKCRVADGVDYILQILQRNRQFLFSRNEDNTIIYIK